MVSLGMGVSTRLVRVSRVTSWGVSTGREF